MQIELFPNIDTSAKFPSTRFQGSKLKYLDWIWHHIQDLPFHSALDAFGGTGAVAYMLKQKGKSVTYNDILKFNSIIGKALIENEEFVVDEFDLENILHEKQYIEYPDFIQKTFPDTYFTDAENRWLDIITTNIFQIENQYKRSVAWFALFQSCIIKRPYNLFHRKNLYIRTQDVKRSFGNKVTWDTPFQTHFRKFINQANNAVFSNGLQNNAVNCNVFDLSNNYDLVYIDPPYISDKGVGVDYLNFYHFLEGLVNYESWESKIDYSTKHNRLKLYDSDWTNIHKIENAFSALIDKFQNSIIVISYRLDGFPCIEKICKLLTDAGKQASVYESSSMKYVLSTKKTSEILIVGK